MFNLREPGSNTARGFGSLSGVSSALSRFGRLGLGRSDRSEVELSPGIELIVEPRQSCHRKEFPKRDRKYAVTLDGRVSHAPFISKKYPWWNADHHCGCDRRIQPSACYQIYTGIKNKNYLDFFKREGLTRLRIFANDFDLDVVLSIWLLKNHDLVKAGKLSPDMLKLIKFEDRVDRAGGALPIDSRSRVARMAAWANYPYEQARQTGKVPHLDTYKVQTAILDIMCRLDKIQAGNPEFHKLDTGYEKLSTGGRRWEMVKETGYYARAKMARDGVRAFVSLREREDKNFTYTIWKINSRFNFPVEELYRVLNLIEDLNPCKGDRWGGSTHGGGSPRHAGSKLRPEEMQKIINGYLEFKKKHPARENSPEIFAQLYKEGA